MALRNWINFLKKNFFFQSYKNYYNIDHSCFLTRKSNKSNTSGENSLSWQSCFFRWAQQFSNRIQRIFSHLLSFCWFFTGAVFGFGTWLRKQTERKIRKNVWTIEIEEGCPKGRNFGENKPTIWKDCDCKMNEKQRFSLFTHKKLVK